MISYQRISICLGLKSFKIGTLLYIHVQFRRSPTSPLQVGFPKINCSRFSFRYLLLRLYADAQWDDQIEGLS